MEYTEVSGGTGGTYLLFPQVRLLPYRKGQGQDHPRRYIEAGLLVSNWGNIIAPLVAEAALLLILSPLRRSTYWALRMHTEGAWNRDDTDSILGCGLFGRRVGLHGFGAIARALTDLMKPFEVSVCAYSPSVPDSIFADKGVKRIGNLEELFRQSEILIELAANTPQNYHMVTEMLLRMLPEHVVFVNIGRGAVVDEQALIIIAKEGRLQVGLDVYEREPLPADSPLRGLRNVTLLPQVGGPTPDRRVDCGKLALENLKRYVSGRPLKNLVTVEVYDRIT